MENKFTPELIEKAKRAKSAEELTALAKENGIELTANAQDTEVKLMELVEDYEPKAVVIDASDTQYICSAGLRIILNVRKKVSDTEVINTSSVVYDIFKTTGFNVVLKVSRARHKRSD